MVRTLNPEKRELLLSTALKLFVANGVQSTSTAEITRTAGMAAGTLFLYFPTKQTLINELVMKIGREQSEAIQGLLHPSFSAQETFSTIWHGTLNWFMANTDAYRLILQVRDTGLVSESVAEESAQFFAYYFDAIQRGLSEDSIKPYPPELMGNILYYDIVAVMNMVRMQPDSTKQTETIQQGFEIFWNGIKK